MDATTGSSERDHLALFAIQIERLFEEPGSAMTIEIAGSKLSFERRTFGAVVFPHLAFSPQHQRIRGTGWVLVGTNDGETISHVNIADVDRVMVTGGGANDR